MNQEFLAGINEHWWFLAPKIFSGSLIFFLFWVAGIMVDLF